MALETRHDRRVRTRECMIVLIVAAGCGWVAGCREGRAVEDAGGDEGGDVGEDADAGADVGAGGDVDVGVDAGEGEGVDAGSPGLTARGRIKRDHRRVDPTRTRLLEVEVVSVAGFEIAVRDGADEVAHGWTDAEGRFALPLAGAPEVGFELVFAALDDADADGGAPRLAVFDSAGVTVPRDSGNAVVAQRLWAWVAAPVEAAIDPGDFGQVHVSEAQGAGAIAVFELLKGFRRRAIDAFAGAPGSPVGAPPTLAVMWSPDINVTCLACYLPTGWGPISWHAANGDVGFDRALFLSGASSAPLHFTPSLVAHELGHWVMDSFSRFPEAQGSHGWGELIAPPLAWSEGFATFFAQWAQSTPESVDPRFFGKQSNVEYWVDLEAIGAGPSATATSLSVVFPQPTQGGGLTQRLNEAVVAALLWDLWDGVGLPGGDEDVALGDVVLTGIALLRGGDFDRGVAGPDLVDALDALACRVMAPAAWNDALMGFPWDALVPCP